MGSVPPMRFLDPEPDPQLLQLRRNAPACLARQSQSYVRLWPLGYGGVSHVPAAQPQTRHA